MGHPVISQWTRRTQTLALMVAIGAASWGCDKLSNAQSEKPANAQAARPANMPFRPEVPSNDVAARINGKPMSRQEIELVVKNLRGAAEAANQQWTPLTDEDQKRLLDGLIMMELKAQDALARGLDRNPEVAQRFAFLNRNFFAQEWDQWQLGRVAVDQAEVEDFYRTNPAYFVEPEQIRVRQLTVGSEEQAKAALVQLLEGNDFVAVATSTSTRPEASNGPMVDQWVMRSREKALYAPNDESIRDLRDPVLEQAAFAVDKPDGVSSYVKGADDQFHIFQLVERKPSRTRPLVEVAETIKILLQQQKLENAARELEHKGQVDRFPDRISEIR